MGLVAFSVGQPEGEGVASSGREAPFWVDWGPTGPKAL